MTCADAIIVKPDQSDWQDRRKYWPLIGWIGWFVQSAAPDFRQSTQFDGASHHCAHAHVIVNGLQYVCFCIINWISFDSSKLFPQGELRFQAEFKERGFKNPAHLSLADPVESYAEKPGYMTQREASDPSQGAQEEMDTGDKKSGPLEP